MHVRRLRDQCMQCLPAEHAAYFLASVLDLVLSCPRTVIVVFIRCQALAFLRMRFEMAVPSVARLAQFTADLLAVLVCAGIGNNMPADDRAQNLVHETVPAAILHASDIMNGDARRHGKLHSIHQHIQANADAVYRGSHVDAWKYFTARQCISYRWCRCSRCGTSWSSSDCNHSH